MRDQRVRGSCQADRGRKIKESQNGQVHRTNRFVFGRQEADEFLASYKPNTNGFVVVFAARMYYGAYLEKGTRRNKTYVVLSSIWNEVSHDEDISFATMAIDTHLY